MLIQFFFIGFCIIEFLMKIELSINYMFDAMETFIFLCVIDDYESVFR